MFYSHEILTNQEYGVATVWLVSTIGLRTTNRKVSRKAIQEVDVRGACGTILKPGAPIALRLQGNLLFGVSRVYDQQCTYVLSDAEKVKSNLRSFHTITLEGNTLDSAAGKSKRDNITLMDDPEFDLDVQLPPFPQFEALAKDSQASRKTSSQLSPLQRDSNAPSISPGGSLLGGFDIMGLRSSQASLNQLRSAEPKKAEAPMMIFDNEEENFLDGGDWGIDIDAEGNLTTIVDEPELPKLPRNDGQEQEPEQEEENSQVLNNGGDILMDLDGPVLPDAEAFPPREEAEEQTPQHGPGLAAAAAPIRQRRQRNPLAPDEETTVSRKTLKEWGDNYLQNAERARNRTRRSAVQATRNVYHLMFGRGLFDVGIPIASPNITNPLTEHFAGPELEAYVLNLPPRAANATPLHRRRTALEALELEEDEEARRVRPRLSAEAEAQQPGQGNADLTALNDEDLIEMAREDADPLPEVHSDVPWNRHSSQIPGSSVKGGSVRHASSRQPSPSPLRGRSSQMFDIERHSDQPVFGSDDLGGAMHSCPDHSVVVEPGLAIPQEARISQALEEALGREGTNFLSFMHRVAGEKGELRGDGKTWVEFDGLFEPQDMTREVVTQAFYHILSLVTRDAIKVEQDGQNEYPFGAIRVGVKEPVQLEEE